MSAGRGVRAQAALKGCGAGRNRPGLAAAVLASAGLLLLVACGGGGGGPTPAPPAVLPGPGVTPALTPLVSISVAPSSLFEDAPGVMTYTIALDRLSTDNTVVTYALGGTATQGADYTTTATGTATIPAGDASVTFTVDPIADTVFEPNETVVAVLTAVTSGSATLNLRADTATGTILNDDAAAGRQERVGRAVYDAGTTITSFMTTANDGSDTVRVKDFAPGRRVANPRWSPDGLQIAFFDLSDPHPITVSSVLNRSYALMVMNADGTLERRLGWADLGSLDWHPNSIHLLFTSSETSVTRPALPPMERGYFYVVDTVTELLTFSPRYVPPALSVGSGDQTMSVRNALWRNPGSTGWPQTVIFTTLVTTCDGVPVQGFPKGVCWHQSKISLQTFGESAVGTATLHPSVAPVNTLHNALPMTPGSTRMDSSLVTVSVNGEVIVFQKFFATAGTFPGGASTGEDRILVYDTETPFSNNAGVPSLQVNATVLPSMGATDFSPDGKKIRYLNAIFNWQTYLAEVRNGSVTNAGYLGLHPAQQLPMHWHLAP